MLVSAGKTPGLGARAQGLCSFSASAHRGLPWKDTKDSPKGSKSQRPTQSLDSPQVPALPRSWALERQSCVRHRLHTRPTLQSRPQPGSGISPSARVARGP